MTKLAEEQLCLAHAARHGSTTTVTALRYFTVYSPRQRPDMFIHRALHAAATGQPLRLYGDGRQRRDVTFVTDIVNATIAAATTQQAANLAINVGSNANTSLHEVVALGRSPGAAPASTTQQRGRPLRSASPDRPACPVAPARPIILTNAERERLEKAAYGHKTPYQARQRASIVLHAARGRSNARIARETGLYLDTARTWRNRFADGGLPALADRRRSGRPALFTPMQVADSAALFGHAVRR